MFNENDLHIDPKEYHFTIRKVRKFFDELGFTEIHAQNRLSILAACEDPTTISTFTYLNKIYPLPQTSQMWLEHELLKAPDKYVGLYSVSTSYREEKNPIKDRHFPIFPMFEFEFPGGIEVLQQLESEFLSFLGFTDEQISIDYEQACERYQTQELTWEHETLMKTDLSSVVFLKNFPRRSSPFWNMAQNEDGTAKKIDVILAGMETIGSAERSCDRESMYNNFKTISDGKYAQLLYDKFGKGRVDAELDTFLSFEFFQRSGGGIGVTRLIKALKEHALLTD